MQPSQPSQPTPPAAPQVAVPSNTFSNDATLRAALAARFPSARFNPTGRILAGAELTQLLQGAIAAIIGLERIDAALLDACPELRVISKFGVGLDSIDLPGCAHRGVAVLSTPGVNAPAVAELTLGLMLALARRIAISTHHLKHGQWVRDGGVQALGKTVGLVGLGHVGKATARLLQATGCSILAHDLLDLSAYCAAHGIEPCSLDRLLGESDFVSLHVPLTPLTRGLIRRPQLRWMKPSAFLINTARGGIVDEDDLADALQERAIAGAASDVFVDEPTHHERLLAQETFIGTPHVGGNSREAIHAVGMAAVTNLLAHLGMTGAAAP
jgi:D-3-phosphoglycerate dehydrogenase